MLNRNNHADLTSYASLLGDSFSSKINLLSQILQNAHYPSLGTYKENLLSKVIREFLPTNYHVGTGFVLFVHEATKARSQKPGFDKHNMGSHSVSKQCDILVYDASKVPVVFKDDNFVILRPESVRAVVEVKGSANQKEVKNILEGFEDFAKKWQECQLFYKEHNQTLVKNPSLYAMCWEVSKNKEGKFLTNGAKIRKQIAKYYKENIDQNNLAGFPILEKLLVYNECEISRTIWSENDDDKLRIGWSTDSGKFIRHDENGEPYRNGDSTISSLLASLQYAVGEEFNRFYSYVYETSAFESVPYEHHGYLK